MDRNQESSRLCAVYAEQSDEELLELDAQREDLTEAAQQALAQVMKDRRLRPTAGTQPAPVLAQSGKQESAEAGEALVYLFNDAFEAREAIRHLNAAQVEHRVVDWHTAAPEGTQHVYAIELALLVPRAEAERAADVLRDKLGLFPYEDAAKASPLPDTGEMTVLCSALIEDGLEEPLAVAQALGRAGITYVWRDSRDQPGEVQGQPSISLAVRAAQLERADEFLAQALSELPSKS